MGMPFQNQNSTEYVSPKPGMAAFIRPPAKCAQRLAACPPQKLGDWGPGR